VRRDFRRDFPMMWVNVMNTGSYDFMMEHIRTFYSPDIVLRQRDLRPGKTTEISYTLSCSVPCLVLRCLHCA